MKVAIDIEKFAKSLTFLLQNYCKIAKQQTKYHKK